MKGFKFTKIAIFILIAVLALAMLAGCGKSKAQQELEQLEQELQAALDDLEDIDFGSGDIDAGSMDLDADPAPAASDLEALICGEWQEIDIDDSYIFHADGTGAEYYDGDSWAMDWVIFGDTLTMDFGDGGVEEYPIEISADGDTLFVYDAEYDTTYEYYRVG